MKRVASCLVVLTVFFFVSAGLAQPKAALRGAWRVVEVSGGPEGANAHPQPGLFVFTDRHYSIMRVTGTAPRPKFASNAVATDSEKVATYDALFSQSGTYEISGSTIVTKAVVAKAEFPMNGPPAKATVKIEGDTLWWTFASGQTVRLTRVE